MTSSCRRWVSIRPLPMWLPISADSMCSDCRFDLSIRLRAVLQDVLKAVDKMIVMGAAMDGGALQEAAKAHAKARSGIRVPDPPRWQEGWGGEEEGKMRRQGGGGGEGGSGYLYCAP